MSLYDLAIIGAGPGGYVGAIRAAQLGLKVVLIEKENLGGVCLNRGCIPTKALIASAHAFHAVKIASEYGVNVSSSDASVDMKRVQARKEEIVKKLRQGIETLLKGRNIEIVKGEAVFSGRSKISVDGKPIDAKNILIAAGSSWALLPNIKIDGRVVVTSDEALDWEEVPKRLLIIGGGVIGCEFACMMSEFGAKVSVVEAMPSILPSVEKAISRLLARSMKQSGIDIFTSVTVAEVLVKGDIAKVKLSNGEEKEFDKVLVSIGRRPYTKKLNLDAGGVALTERGFIKVDKNFKTSAENVYAIGDVVGHPMLAHAASFEAIVAVENMLGLETRDTRHVTQICPSPIFTTPEIGSVGMTSEELDANGTEYKTGRFPYLASGKAMCDGETEGQAVIHSDLSGKILGAHIIGKDATTLIAEVALAMQNGLTVKDIAHTIHSHPTLSEVVAEAAEDVFGEAIHKLDPRHETRDTRPKA